jgi:hypothetical protein
VQALELRAWLDADVLDELLARVAVGRERVGLPAAAVQRQQPLRVQPLAQRVLGQQGVDLADDLLVAACSQVGVDGQLRGRQAQRLEPADLRTGERLVGDVGERVAAEERERLPRAIAWGAAGRLAHQPLEPQRVDELAVDQQLVRAPTRDDLRAAVGSHDLAQAPDVVLDHLRGARRRFLTPEPFDQALGGDEPVRFQAEHGQHCALLRSAERDRMVVDTRFEVSEEADPHAAAGVVLNVCDQPNHLL